MLTTEERIKICATCKNRKMNLKKGLLCAMTDDKPQFKDTCESYVLDEKEKAAEKAREEMNKADWQGPSDSDGLLDGAGWFIVIPCLSILNILLLFFGWHFLAGNTTTEILQVAVLMDLANPVFGYFGMASIIAFYFLTWYLAAKKGSKYAYVLGFSVYTLDAVVLLYDSFALGLNLNMWVVINLIFRVFVLASGFKIYDLRKSKPIEVFKTRAFKYLYALFAAVCVLFSAYSFIIIGDFAQNKEKELENVVNDSSPQQDIHSYIAQQNINLPIEIGNGIVWTKVVLENNVMVHDYKINDVYAADIDMSMINPMIVEEKQQLLRSIVEIYDNDTSTRNIVDLLIRQKHTVQYRYNDCEGQFIYAVTISPEDLQEAIISRK